MASLVEAEIATPAACRRQAAALATRVSAAPAPRGAGVAVIRCGTSPSVGEATAG